ncbi:MAG: hypothetical protein R3E86_01985 [Pseudomonadales bacterium]
MSLRAIRWLLCALALALVCAGCVAPRIGGPSAPRDDPDAGILTLPGGRAVAVYPDDLAYTGDASYQWPDGRRYTGSWRAGKPDGMGSETLPDGETYTGGWQDGARQGHGELSLADGSRYVGAFAGGVRSGEGVLRGPAGLYRGGWDEDLPNGEGEYHGNDGSSYVGEWYYGRRAGYGTYTAADGSSYEGDWADDQPNGFGTMTGSDGSHYSGEWLDGRRSGYGRLVTASGLAYEGTWVDDERQGYGVEERPDGSRYEGEWQADRRHGQGREDNPDGSLHDGSWESNRAFGPGRRRNAAGIEISGVWNGDTVSAGLLHLPTGIEYAGPLFRDHNRKVSPRLQSWLQGHAERGDPYAQMLLGSLYQDFEEPPPDTQLARRWLELAATAGVAEAGTGWRGAISATTRHEPSAAGTGGQRGHAGACDQLGEYYHTGRLLPRDLGKALDYYRRAAAARQPARCQQSGTAAGHQRGSTLRDPAARAGRDHPRRRIVQRQLAISGHARCRLRRRG